MNNKKILLLLPLILIVVAVVFLLIRSCAPRPEIFTGTFETTVVDVASEIPGRIDTIFVTRGDFVQKGDLLATIQPNIMNAKLGQAEGVLQAAKALVEKAERGAREQEKTAAKNQYEMAKSQFEFAEKTYLRFTVLYADSIISRQEMDEIEFKYHAAEDEMNAANAMYDMALQGARIEDIEAAKGEYYEARSVYNEALAYHKELDVIAPVSGVVCSRIANPGEVMGAGYPLLSIQMPDQIYLLLNVREDKLAHFTKGTKCNVRIPALNNQSFEFVVHYLSSMADFATWVPTKASGQFDLKTFEVHLKPLSTIEELHPGMTAQVYTK